MIRMMNSPHPGETLREDVLPALGLTVTDAAQALGVTRTALSRVLNGRRVFRRKWPCALRHGWASSTVAAQRCGCACKSPTTWPKLPRHPKLS